MKMKYIQEEAIHHNRIGVMLPNMPIPVIVVREYYEEVEIQLWANEYSNSIASVRFVKDEWNGFIYRVERFQYDVNLAKTDIKRILKMIEPIFVNVISCVLINKSNSNVIGTKKYFYFYLPEGQDCIFRELFEGVKAKPETSNEVYVYEAS